jgi:hypothetical protein
MGKRRTAELLADPRDNPLATWPFPDTTRYFMSGSNNPLEIEVARRRFQNVGTAAPETGPKVEQALTALADEDAQRRLERYRLARPPMPGAHDALVFVDSGAFSEVEFHDDGPPTYPKPISHGEWEKRLEKYDRLAAALGPQLFAVAPDKIADQDVTLERQRRYAGKVQQLLAKRANVLVPVQKGSRSMADFFTAELEALGVEPGDPRIYAAIPLKKDATSLEDLEAFVAETRDRFGFSCEEDPDRDPPVRGRMRLHFLGRGAYSPDYRATFDAVKRACPTAIVTSDSVRIRAMVGEDRPLTQALGHLKALGVGEAGPRKRAALEATNELLDAIELGDANAAGWYDSELDDSAEAAARRLRKQAVRRARDLEATCKRRRC